MNEIACKHLLIFALQTLKNMLTLAVLGESEKAVELMERAIQIIEENIDKVN